MAVLLTVGLVEAWRSGAGAGEWAAFGVVQLVGGVAVGAFVGLAGGALLGRVRLPTASSAVLALALGGLAYGIAAVLGASGFLAIYVAGVLLARTPRLVRSLRVFHEALATAAQAVLFLLLGLLVFPSDLVDDVAGGVVVAAVLVFVARPLAVATCLPWFRFRPREQALVAWAGLRGAVPVVLATLPLTSGHPDGARVFDIVFVAVLVTVAVQAPTVGPLAGRLGLTSDGGPPALADVVPIDNLQADAIELTLTEAASVCGRPLAEARPPSRARIAVVERDGAAFVPDGQTVLQRGDVVLVVLPPGSDIAPLLDWAAGR